MRVRRGLALCLLWVGAVWGDTWLPARPIDVPSANGKYVAHLIPTLVGTLDYFKDKAKDVRTGGNPANFCHVSIERSGQPEVWNSRLSNEVAPVSLLLSNDGRHLATLDNWHSAGYGSNVVALHEQPGRAVAQ